MNNYIYIAVMFAVSYTIRILPLTLIRKPIKNQFIQSFLYYAVSYTHLPHDAGHQNQPDDFDDAEPVQQGLRTGLVHFSQTLRHFFGLYCENGGGIIAVEYGNHRPKADMFKGENILWQIVLF